MATPSNLLLISPDLTIHLQIPPKWHRLRQIGFVRIAIASMPPSMTPGQSFSEDSHSARLMTLTPSSEDSMGGTT